MRAARRDPRHSGTGERAVGRIRNPALQILFRHPRVVGDQPGQIHRVVITGVVKIERKLVVLLDALLDLLQLRDLNAKERLLHAVVGHHPFVAVAAQRLQLCQNFFCGHYIRGRTLYEEGGGIGQGWQGRAFQESSVAAVMTAEGKLCQQATLFGPAIGGHRPPLQESFPTTLDKNSIWRRLVIKRP